MPTPVHLVFGATGGMGSETVRRLAAAGFRVAVAARTPATVEDLAREVSGLAIPCDASDPLQVERAVRQTVERFGRLDGIACFVGSILLKPAHLTSASEFETTLRQNLHPAFHAVHYGSRAMMNEGGSIVLCSSAVARTGFINHEAIAAAKAGVAGLALSAAATYAARGIRVNCIAPGLVDTPMAAGILRNDASRRVSETMHPLGRLGRPSDIAEAAVWLLDRSRSSWVTGQVIGIDGGLGTLRAR